MNSRIAISALFIVIASLVVASQGSGLLEKLKVFEASCASKISAVDALPILDRSLGGRNPARAPGSVSPDAQTAFSNFCRTTQLLGAHARHLQRLVLNVINSDHQGE